MARRARPDAKKNSKLNSKPRKREPKRGTVSRTRAARLQPYVRLWVHASELLTGEGVVERDGRRVVDADLGAIADGALAVECVRDPRSGREVPGKILWVGETRRIPREVRARARVVEDLGKRRALVPGLVDCHTHLPFAGDRASEFARRCAGATYQEIAAEGGGIARTVWATRAASPRALLDSALARVEEAHAFGVRVIEAKSGYGLSHAHELKLLATIAAVRRARPDLEFHATYLGAHAFPPAGDGTTREEYLREMLERTLPEIARRRLAESCDVFVDEGYYTRAEGARLLGRARELGLATRVHADELVETDSARLAVEHGALSADHLLRVSREGIAVLARSATTAVLLPGTSFYLKAAPAPARALLDAGARVAVATDFNPGTSVTLNLPATLTIAALYLGMSRAELFAAATYNAACALGLGDRVGALLPGRRGLAWAMPFATFEECYYRFAWAPPPAGGAAT